MSVVGLRSARRLFDDGDFRGCANRAYYAAYHAATAACVEHGDTFGREWNNPPHEQLPELIQNNGDLPIATRRRVNQLLRPLRNARENADYRPGITVEREDALAALRSATTLLRLLKET